MTPRRLRMEIQIEALPVRVCPQGVRLAPMSAAFSQAELGVVIFDAYEGTRAGEGVTRQVATDEIEVVKQGEYGPFVPEASLILSGAEGMRAAILITLFEGLPLVSYVVTRKAHQGRGYASLLMYESGQVLQRQGWARLSLYVDEDNPAQRLYRRLGFLEVEEG